MHPEPSQPFELWNVDSLLLKNANIGTREIRVAVSEGFDQFTQEATNQLFSSFYPQDREMWKALYLHVEGKSNTEIARQIGVKDQKTASARVKVAMALVNEVLDGLPWANENHCEDLEKAIRAAALRRLAYALMVCDDLSDDELVAVLSRFDVRSWLWCSPNKAARRLLNALNRFPDFISCMLARRPSIAFNSQSYCVSVEPP